MEIVVKGNEIPVFFDTDDVLLNLYSLFGAHEIKPNLASMKTSLPSPQERGNMQTLSSLTAKDAFNAHLNDLMPKRIKTKVFQTQKAGGTNFKIKLTKPFYKY